MHYQEALRVMKKLLRWSGGILTLHAVTFLLMPFVLGVFSGGRWRSVVLGLIFWSSLLAGYILLFLANQYRREYNKRNPDGEVLTGKRAGFFTVCSNVPGTVADTLFIVALIALGILALIGIRQSYVIYILLAILAFSFHMHGILNGRIFQTAGDPFQAYIERKAQKEQKERIEKE